MKYPDEEYRDRYRCALKAATNLASVACYRTDQPPAFLHPRLREGVNVPAENLTLWPTGGGCPHDLGKAVREARTTVLVIEPGCTTDSRPTFYFTIVICRAGKVEWLPARRLWVDLDRKPYLVPDPDGEEPDGECFAIDRGVRSVAAPWTNKVERQFGLMHGDVLLLAP